MLQLKWFNETVDLEVYKNMSLEIACFQTLKASQKKSKKSIPKVKVKKGDIRKFQKVKSQFAQTRLLFDIFIFFDFVCFTNFERR